MEGVRYAYSQKRAKHLHQNARKDRAESCSHKTSQLCVSTDIYVYCFCSALSVWLVLGINKMSNRAFDMKEHL